MITPKTRPGYCAWLNFRNSAATHILIFLFLITPIFAGPSKILRPYSSPVTIEEINAALADISAEQDPTLKHLKLAGLVSSVFQEENVELVVVGGSAIEFYTEGAYVSGDIDFCLRKPPALSLRKRQEIMGRFGADGGPRSWQVAGQFVDILGEVESLAATPGAELATPFGLVRLVSPEDLLVERVLVSVYPGRNEAATACARKLAAVALAGRIQFDWAEARRLAERPEYDILPQLKSLVQDLSHELGKRNPYHPARPAD